MRKFCVILVLVLFSFSLIGCWPSPFRRYKNSEYKFSILVPKDWEIDDDVEDAAVVFSIPQQEPGDYFSSNARVVIEDLPAAIDLSTYYDVNREEFKQVFKKMGDVSEGQGMSKLVRYQWIAFTSQVTDTIFVRAISVVWMKDKRVFVMTCVMGLPSAPKIEPLFRKMISSFTIR